MEDLRIRHYRDLAPCRPSLQSVFSLQVVPVYTALRRVSSSQKKIFNPTSELENLAKVPTSKLGSLSGRDMEIFLSSESETETFP